MRRICVFTGTRAEYGLLKPLMNRLLKSTRTNLQLLISGMHLAPEFGLTYQDIESDGFTIDEKVEMLMALDTPTGITKSMGVGMIGFADAFARLNPELLVVLGDRFEAMSVCTAAMVARIPIVHIHGGEATHALIDEAIRHSITKMSHIHFTTTETYRKRVIQLGEHPCRVINVGSLGVENIRNLKLIEKTVLEKKIGFSLQKPYLLVTFHPVTLEKGQAYRSVKMVCQAIKKSGFNAVFTKANADTEGDVINITIESFAAKEPERFIVFSSMGTLNYLSAMKHCAAVVGNSSSGIIEAPSIGVPTVDIGERQSGRVRADSVISCLQETQAISRAITRAVSPEFSAESRKVLNPYEREATSQMIFEKLITTPLTGLINKTFFDFNSTENI